MSPFRMTPVKCNYTSVISFLIDWLYYTPIMFYMRMLYYRLGATLTILRERCVEGDDGEENRRALEILVRRVPDDQKVRVT